MYPMKIFAHEANVNIIRFNYDGDLLFSGQRLRTINVFQSYTGQLLGSYTTRVAVKTLDVDIDSKYLVCGSFDGTVEIFRVDNGQRLLLTNFPSYKIYHMEFDLSSKKLLVLYESGMSGNIMILNFEDIIKNVVPSISNSQNRQTTCDKLKILFSFSLKSQDSPRVLASKAKWYVDNQTIFIGTHAGDVLHYTQSGKLLKKQTIHPSVKITSITFSNDFSILATAATDGSKVLNPQTLQILRVFKQEFPMNDVSISPLFNHPKHPKHHIIMAGGVDAKQAAQTKDAGFDLHLCNVMYGHQIGTLALTFSPINSIQFFKDGLGYVTGSQDGYITIVRFDQQSYLNDAVYQ